MWIPHRVFFAHVAFVIGMGAGLLLLILRPMTRYRIAHAVLVPPAILGAFIGLTATRGMYLFWWDRIRIGAWVTGVVAVWLLGAAGTLILLQRIRASRIVQVVGTVVAAAALFGLTLWLLAPGRDDLLHRAIRDALR